MRLDDVLQKIGPLVGVSSLLGAPESVGTRRVTAPTLPEARAQLDRLRKAQETCGSDAAYWGYEGQAAYAKTLVSLLEAAEITGPDNLPDLPPPDLGGKVLMDACSDLTQWGARLLRQAKEEAPMTDPHPPAPASGECPVCGGRLDAEPRICYHTGKAHAPAPSPPDAGRMSEKDLAYYEKGAIGHPLVFRELRRAREEERKLRQEREEDHRVLDYQNAEIGKLEKVIEDAPHAEECRTRPRRSGDERGWLPASGVCDCWKSAALEGRTK